MPVPIGPRQMRTSTSPAWMRPALIAAIAAASVRNTRASPVNRYTPSDPMTLGSMAVALITDPSGAMFPTGAQNVDVSPRRLASSGAMITSSGSTPSRSSNCRRSRARRSDDSHSSSCWPRLIPLTVNASGSRSPARFRCSITSGTPPAWNTCTVGWCRGPFGSASTRRGTRRLMAVQALASGRVNPAACATAGRWRIRFVEPPKAACVTIALCSAASVRMSRIRMPRASSAIKA